MIRLRLTHALTLSLVLLVVLALVQGATAYWSSRVATFHVERSALVNQLLSGFSELAADKQRLKVWMAQSLLTGDRNKMQVHRAGKRIELTAKELAVLELLLSAPQRVFSRERILANVWGASEDPLTNVVDVYIRRLRVKIDEGFDPPLIRTVRGFGYKIDISD